MKEWSFTTKHNQKHKSDDMKRHFICVVFCLVGFTIASLKSCVNSLFLLSCHMQNMQFLQRGVSRTKQKTSAECCVRRVPLSGLYLTQRAHHRVYYFLLFKKLKKMLFQGKLPVLYIKCGECVNFLSHSLVWQPDRCWKQCIREKTWDSI